ncbi:dynein axonemal heavy chain 7-like [Penaeus chinensis]|uniref:dynein axonemal heavy chain 7-like n=1 Tax=Penaeus chinensis TaxID=139456 RepID=UPI001FB737BA|nr:dynein axonemal heavy chain 7-like [Penaeus chinensis]
MIPVYNRSETFLERVLAEWIQAVVEAELEVTTPFSLVDILTPPLHVRAWGLEGLPTDAFSLQNATAIKHTVNLQRKAHSDGPAPLPASRWPYLVDPDEQGTRWLQLHEAANELVVLREQDFNAPASRPGGGAVAQITLLEDALARCIPKGRPVLLMDLAGDPPSQLADLVARNTREEGGVRVVTISSLTLQYHPGFRLYLASRHARPSLSLETAASLTVVNFTVTVQGLHDNLRQILVRKERPELEDERQKLVLTTSSHQRALQDTEERILHTLSSAQGNILESEEAINILQETKQMSDDIKRKQEQCVETEAALLECCKQYESVSRPAASLYITLASLASVSPMYQFSLRWYVDLYVAVIDTTGKSSVLERRLSLLQEALVSRVHSAVVKGLAAPHRLPFTFLIALHALRVSGAVNPSVESALFRLASQSPAGCTPPPDWLAVPLAPAWPALLHLTTLPEFEGEAVQMFFVQEVADFASAGLSESLEKDAVGWVSLTSCALPEKSALPRPWHRLQPVLWLLLVAALRLDKLTWAVRVIVGDILGAHFSSPPPVDVGVFLEAPAQPKSSSRTPAPARPPAPLLLVTSPGVDALEEVLLLAAQGPEGALANVSLGQGQSSVAEAAVQSGASEGGWVVLQNLHHALDWLPTLANIITRLYTEGVPNGGGGGARKANGNGGLHPNFRLILTTEPTDEFPVSLLRSVEKVYVDAPGDARHALLEANLTLTRHASNLTFSEEDEEEEVEAAIYRLLHGLSVFHTVVSERGRHGHLAWADPPAFTATDLTLAISVVTSSVEEGRDVDPEMLEYLVGRVFYGGRVHRVEDQQVILSILKEVLTISLKLPEEITPRSAEGAGEEEEEEDEEEEELEPTGGGVDDAEDVGLVRLFPDFVGRLDDLAEFVAGITGLDRPEIFGLPAGVQQLQEIEAGQRFLTVLATVGGAQSLQGKSERISKDEVNRLKKMRSQMISADVGLLPQTYIDGDSVPSWRAPDYLHSASLSATDFHF